MPTTESPVVYHYKLYESIVVRCFNEFIVLPLLFVLLFDIPIPRFITVTFHIVEEI